MEVIVQSQLAIAAIMITTSMSSAAFGQTQIPLCDFVTRVVAARANDFASIRGPEEELLGAKTGLYVGKLSPGPTAKCSVGRDKGTVSYICNYDSAESMAAMKPIYERYRADLVKCYSDISFDDGTRGSEEKHNEQWFVAGQNAQVKLTLSASNLAYINKNKPALLQLSIRSLP